MFMLKDQKNVSNVDLTLKKRVVLILVVRPLTKTILYFLH